MTLKQIVNELRRLGHKVEFVKRKDGSIRIVELDGARFSSSYSQGNRLARDIAGERLSERKQSQMERGRKSAETQRKSPAVKRARQRLPQISPEAKKALRRVQRALRKKGEGSGTVTTRQVRKNIERYGEEKAIELLERQRRYHEGFAYPENVETLASRVEIDAVATNNEALKRVASWIRAHAQSFREEWIGPINELLYDLEQVATWADEEEVRRKANETAAEILAICQG